MTQRNNSPPKQSDAGKRRVAPVFLITLATVGALAIYWRIGGEGTPSQSQNPLPHLSPSAALAPLNAKPLLPVATVDGALEATIARWLITSFKACWTPPKTSPDGDPYLPRIRVSFKLDGTFASPPKLLNPPSDPEWRPVADAAVRAVKTCGPLHIPSDFAPYYPQWKVETIFFDSPRS